MGGAAVEGDGEGAGEADYAEVVALVGGGLGVEVVEVVVAGVGVDGEVADAHAS